MNSCRSALKGFFPIKVLKFPSSVSNMRGLAAGWDSGSGLDLITPGCNKSGLWVADEEVGWLCGASRGSLVQTLPSLFWLEDSGHINT